MMIIVDLNNKNRMQQLVELPGDCYIYKDRFGRCWQLIPINNPSVMMPFIIKPLSEEKYLELSRS